jgi:hypothetical protein
MLVAVGRWSLFGGGRHLRFASIENNFSGFCDVFVQLYSHQVFELSVAKIVISIGELIPIIAKI